MRSKHILGLASAVMAGIALPLTVHGQEPSFVLQLNDAQSVNEGCRLTYVVENLTGAGIDASAFEMAVFAQTGRIASMSVFEFGAMAEGRTKVVQFDLTAPPCEEISRILINDLDQCLLDGEQSDLCFAALEADNLTEIDFGL